MITSESADLFFEKIATSIPEAFDTGELDALQAMLCSPVGLKSLIRVYAYANVGKEQVAGIDNSTQKGQHEITKIQGKMAGAQEVILGLISLITIPQENEKEEEDDIAVDE